MIYMKWVWVIFGAQKCLFAPTRKWRKEQQEKSCPQHWKRTNELARKKIIKTTLIYERSSKIRVCMSVSNTWEGVQSEKKQWEKGRIKVFFYGRNQMENFFDCRFQFCCQCVHITRSTLQKSYIFCTLDKVMCMCFENALHFFVWLVLFLGEFCSFLSLFYTPQRYIISHLSGAKWTPISNKICIQYTVQASLEPYQAFAYALCKYASCIVRVL